MVNEIHGRLLPAVKNGGFFKEDLMIWCGSVIKGEDGRFHMFASSWNRTMGFGNQWLFNSQVVRASSDTPEGPFHLEQVVLPRRGREFFDGMSTHNPYIREWNGRYYLYYMGTTYGGPIPQHEEEISPERSLEVWNKKRIGLAVSESVFGPWKRRDEPLLEPRDCSHWDCTITSNPAAAILPNGNTYLLYKSRSYANATLKIGVAYADHPQGPFRRLTEDPLFSFQNPNYHLEDPYLWFEDGKFRLLIKDDFKNQSGGICGEWGAGLYGESMDCIHWSFAEQPKAYSRTVTWDDGSVTTQCNLERPFLLLQDGRPTHLYLATGNGTNPYQSTWTWNIVMPLAGRQAET
ncbi:MAG: glycosyl hydrolase family 43 [Clostridiales bacterium]|jgi:hypothetical protein|nr:glycosyl hydrolase family 43 [Clostridiales bacterium]